MKNMSIEFYRYLGFKKNENRNSLSSNFFFNSLDFSEGVLFVPLVL